MAVPTVPAVGVGPVTTRATTVTVVLRLARAELLAGRLVGGAELVASGERAVVRDAQELLEFLRERGGE